VSFPKENHMPPDISTVSPVFDKVETLAFLYGSFRFGNRKGKRLLGLWCGAEEASVCFALQGADVTACDISSEMLGGCQAPRGQVWRSGAVVQEEGRRPPVL